MSDIKKLFNNKDSFPDFHIITQAEVIVCHKSILALRCPKFKAMFSSNMKEQTSVDFTEYNPIVIKWMLEYLYNWEFADEDDIKKIEKHIIDTIFILDSFGLESVCEEIINDLEINNLEVKVIFDIYKLDHIELLKEKINEWGHRNMFFSNDIELINKIKGNANLVLGILEHEVNLSKKKSVPMPTVTQKKYIKKEPGVELCQYDNCSRKGTYPHDGKKYCHVHHLRITAPPKKPMNAYMHFLYTCRKYHKNQIDKDCLLSVYIKNKINNFDEKKYALKLNRKSGVFSFYIAKLWKKQTDDEKKIWKDIARNEKIKYDKEIIEFSKKTLANNNNNDDEEEEEDEPPKKNKGCEMFIDDECEEQCEDNAPFKFLGHCYCEEHYDVMTKNRKKNKKDESEDESEDE
jgi:hypothetical protein